MRIKYLKNYCFSTHGDLQMAVLYDYNSQKVIDTGTVDGIIERNGEFELTRIQAHDDELILEVRL